VLGAGMLVGTRSRLIRGSGSAGHVRCSASDGSCTPARPASPVLNASLDSLRRTRRNVDRIRAAAPDLTSRRPAAVRAGARPYHRPASPNLIVKEHPPKRCLSAAVAIKDHFVQLTININKRSVTASPFQHQDCTKMSIYLVWRG
jgi:hypothetical protein